MRNYIPRRPRWNKVLSDLWGNKIRTLLVIASIMVGLFAVGLISSMTVIISEDLAAGYRSVNPANVLAFTTPFDDDLVERVRRLPGVADAQGRRVVTLRVRTASGKWDPIEINAIPDIESMSVNRVHLEEGLWPPKKREIVVDRFKLGDLPVSVNGSQVNGSIEVELPSGKIRTIPLVGVINDQTIGMTGGGGFFLAPVQGYVTADTLEWLEQADTYNRLYVTAAENSNDKDWLRELSNRVSNAVEDAGGVVYASMVRASNDHPNRVYVDALAAVLYMLGFLVVFLSGFLITNTLAALLNQQMYQIGIMKTIGARRLQVMGIYMLLIFVFGITAFVIALPLSSRAAYALLEFFTHAINMNLQGYRVVPQAVIIELVIALVVPQAAGFIPIWHGTRISAVEALSGYSQAHPQGGRSWVDRARWRKLPRPLLLSLRNTFRRRGRLFLTLLTLTLGGAVFIATFNVQRSLTSYIERIGSYFMADINVSLEKEYRIDKIRDLLSEIPEVDTVEGWAAASGSLVMADGSDGESFHLLAPPAHSPVVKADMLEGVWVDQVDFPNAIAVNERFREVLPGLKVNDTLTIEINGDKTDVVVVGFFRMAGRSSGFLAYTTYEYLSNQIHQANVSYTYRIKGKTPHMTLEQQDALGDDIEKHLADYGIRVTEVSAGHSLTATTADGLNVLTLFLLIMASLIAIVGSIGLMGTMSMNVLERTREIGVVRAIGASNRAVMNMVMVEGVLIGLMSWFFGSLLAFPISTLMSNAINLSLFGAVADFTFTPIGVVLWLVVVLLLSSLASVLPARNAVRLTIREVLSYE